MLSTRGFYRRSPAQWCSAGRDWVRAPGRCLATLGLTSYGIDESGTVRGGTIQVLRDGLQIGKELPSSLIPGVVGSPQNRGWVDRGHDGFGQLGANGLSAVLGDAELFAEQRLGGRGTKRDDHARLDQTNLLLKPGIAGAHLGG